ncbi:Fic family protein [Puia dinghuensis]|uniref:Cell division protein Fic n=1 Tax=Puia dinghuensis TaxID=1792502 RepID=A0A8J2UFH0_9BACT|nr:Fic family protein [Puia dinghuensis]GGB10529.1 cell division protein Fic [Puia dinghuensis]
MALYIYERKEWPNFFWKQENIAPKLAEVRHHQGRLLGRMEGIGFSLQAEANLHTLTLDVLKSSEIEGEILNPDQVRSSIARRLGMDIAGLIPADRHVEGIVEMMLDATQNYNAPLTGERLFSWHAAMFPTGRSGMHRIIVGNYRDNSKDDPMQVISGPMGKEKVHFQAPDSDVLVLEMNKFLDWFNSEKSLDPVIKAAIAHLWFVTIHPFDDGNGRITRAITDMLLSRADQNAQRFYSMSSQIRVERKEYYDVLEKTQKGSLDITGWLDWFLICLDRALTNTDETLGVVIKKARFWEKYSAIPLNDRQRTMLNKLLDGFDGKLTSSKWAKITKTSQDTAGRDINDLVLRGLLAKEPGGGRSTSYVLSFNY